MRISDWSSDVALPILDNILRPILVGRDTRIPDYVVLITTLGGIDLFGFNGIVIGPVIAALFIATWNIVTKMRTGADGLERSEEHTSELQSLMRISYAVFCLKKKKDISGQNSNTISPSLTQESIRIHT